MAEVHRRIDVRAPGIVLAHVGPAALLDRGEQQARRQRDEADVRRRLLRLEGVHHVVHGEELVPGKPQDHFGVFLHARERGRAADDAPVGVVELEVVVLVGRHRRVPAGVCLRDAASADQRGENERR